MTDTVLGAAIVLGVVVVFAGTGFAWVYFGNLAIGRHYDAQARRLLPLLAAEGVLFEEHDVRTTQKWLAPLSASVRWRRADLRVTPRALYVFQWSRIPLVGARMGQPVIAILAGGTPPDPAVVGLVAVATLTRPPELRPDGVVFAGSMNLARFEIRIEPSSPPLFAAVLARTGMLG